MDDIGEQLKRRDSLRRMKKACGRPKDLVDLENLPE
jgi:hypothetical protein